MSRFHPVRPKKHKHHQVPQPAAPAQQAGSKAAEERANQVFQELYKLRNGPEIDASIARCRKLLAVHDRELDAAAKADPGKQHRWTVSPSIAFRYDVRLHQLLEQREQLQAECWAAAKQALAEYARHAQTSSLCPPKHPEPATQADPQPQAGGAPAKEAAAGPPIVTPAAAWAGETGVDSPIAKGKRRRNARAAVFRGLLTFLQQTVEKKLSASRLTCQDQAVHFPCPQALTRTTCPDAGGNRSASRWLRFQPPMTPRPQG